MTLKEHWKPWMNETRFKILAEEFQKRGYAVSAEHLVFHLKCHTIHRDDIVADIYLDYNTNELRDINVYRQGEKFKHTYIASTTETLCERPEYNRLRLNDILDILLKAENKDMEKEFYRLVMNKTLEVLDGAG